MKVPILFLLLFSGILSAQSDFITQITDYNYDSRNPSILVKPLYNEEDGEFVFEIHEGSSTNLGLIRYFSETDSFTAPLRITNNNYQNISPSIINYYNDQNTVLFQTNQEGNQDIAISEEIGGTWSDPVLLTTSIEDETEPSFLLNSAYEYFDTLWVLYEKNHSIHLVSFKDGITADRIIFQASDSISYSNADGIKYSLMNFVAVEHSPSHQNIVYRTFNNVNGNLSPIEIVNERGISNSPRIFHFYTGSDFLSYEMKPDTGYQNIYFLYYWPEITDPEPFIDNPVGDNSSLRVSPVDIVTGRFVNFTPNTYLVVRNDSTFIRLNKDENMIYEPDTLFFTKVDHAKADNGGMGTDWPYLIYYTIFEDSADGFINLFARKERVLVSGVMGENLSVEQFRLIQNYPNPFNPSTNVSFVIGNSSFVTLKVYDALGREVATLVNEEKSPGTYDISFDASGLSSGIYFYKLQAGSFSATRKMILVK